MTTKYSNRWGYDAQSMPPRVENYRLVNGFKYYSIIGVAYVKFFRTDAADSYTTTDLATYINSFSDRPIEGAFIKLLNGSEAGGRNGQSIQPVQYQPQPVVTIAGGSPRQFEVDPNTGRYVKIEDSNKIIDNMPVGTEDIILYYPTSSQGGGTAQALTGLCLAGYDVYTTWTGTYEEDSSNTFKASSSSGYVWTNPAYADWDTFRQRGSSITSTHYAPNARITV